MKHIVDINNIDAVFSYADRRYSSAAAYTGAGFKMLGVTPPGYMYWKSNIVYSRRQFRKADLSDKLPIYDESLSEAVNMFTNGYRRIWDAGHHKLLWKKS